MENPLVVVFFSSPKAILQTLAESPGGNMALAGAPGEVWTEVREETLQCTPKSMVYFIENPTKIDDLRVSPF